MKCDVSSVLKVNGGKIPIDFDFSDFSEISDSEFDFRKVHVSGTITNIGDVLEFTAKADGEFSVACARCAKPLDEVFSVEFKEVLKNIDDNVSESEDVVFFKGHTVDLADIVRSNILLNMSTKYLCRPDCKGLCPFCGANLNETSCKCENDFIDPRMEGLKKLLKERQEV